MLTMNLQLFAHKKGVGSTKNGRDSESKRLGAKRADGQFVKAGNILFIEDVAEQVYQVQRLLYHLRLAGILPRLAGLMPFTTSCSGPVAAGITKPPGHIQKL